MITLQQSSHGLMGIFYLFLFCCLLQGSASPFTKTLRPESHFHCSILDPHLSPSPLRKFPTSTPLPQSQEFIILHPFVSFNPIITTAVCQCGHYISSSGSFCSLCAIIQILFISLSNEQEKGKKKVLKTPQETFTQCQ